MCKLLKVNKSSYYAWLTKGSSDRWKDNEILLVQIKDIFANSHHSYGSPRIAKELRAQNKVVSRNRVAKIMQAAGIQARKRKKYVATTDSKHSYPIVPNILNRGFVVERLGQVWVSDITYVRTQNGWLYLTVIIDLYNRKVIGWSMSKSLEAQQTIIPAWRMAVNNCPVTGKLLFHSDRGVQYACEAFTNILKSNKLIIRSMSRKGNCWDNAVAESFFKTIKVEWIYSRTFMNQNQATLSIFEWIESWYNKKRRHSFLDYMTIDEFEKLNINFATAA